MNALILWFVMGSMPMFAQQKAATKAAVKAPAKAAAKAATKTTQKGTSKASPVEEAGGRVRQGGRGRDAARCPRRPTEDQMKVYASLFDRNLALKQKAARQDAEGRRLEDLQRQIAAQREELLKLQRQLDEELTERELAEAKVRAQRLRKLVKIYEKMQAASASRAIQGMDRELVVEMMLQMKPKIAANMMNLLPGRAAARLSEEISDRKKGLIESLLEQVEETR
jgi:flagellar motility protein MotE (MotC chaperone)|tara:strand:- start:1543 stop:2217 length:675 start_codon:yes stop_codon:yes gene_type:complete